MDDKKQSENTASLEPDKKLGRFTSAPAGMPPRAWVPILRRTAFGFLSDRVMLFSAGVTLYMLLALVPALTMIVSIYGFFSNPSSIASQLALLNGIVPAGGLEIIQGQLSRLTTENTDTLGWTFIGAFAVALWSASLGIKGLFEAMNIAYGEAEKRNFFAVNALALLFTLGVALSAVAAIAAVIVLPAILSILSLGELAETTLSLGTFLALAVILWLGLAVLYRWGPSRREAKWKWITPGSVFSVLAILGLSLLFSWYVANMGNYSATYGSLGALIGFLTWMWLSIMAVVLGAKLNAEIEHQTALDTTIPPEKPMGKRGAYVADTLGE